MVKMASSSIKNQKDLKNFPAGPATPSVAQSVFIKLLAVKAEPKLSPAALCLFVPIRVHPGKYKFITGLTMPMLV